MIKIYFIITFLLFLLWEIAFSKIRLDEVVVTYDYNGKPKTMHVMASNNRGISWRPQYSPNIYFTQHYGYYEVFMCPCMYWQQYTTGCLDEIVTEKSFRFANVATPNFSWFIDKFTHHERKVIDTTKFELCIIDGTQHMRKSSMKRSQASLGQRIRMPRYCWVIQLRYQPISYDTLWKMQNATKLELLKRKRKKFYDYKVQYDERIKAEKKRYNELVRKHDELFEKVEHFENEYIKLREKYENNPKNVSYEVMNQTKTKYKQASYEASKQHDIVMETQTQIENTNEKEIKIINDMKVEVKESENEFVEQEKKLKIEINNEVIIKDSNNLDKLEEMQKIDRENPAFGLNAEARKEMKSKIKLKLRKKRNASNKIIDAMKINSQLKADKTNEKVKEIENAMIMDNQGTAFTHSKEDKLAKMDQDFINTMEEHGIDSNELKDEGPLFDQFNEEEFTRMNEEIDKIRKENEARKKEFARGNEKMEKIWKEHGVRKIDLTDEGPLFDQFNEEEFTRMNEEIDKIRKENETRKKELARGNEKMKKIWKEHGVRKIDLTDEGPLFDQFNEEEFTRMNEEIDKIRKENETRKKELARGNEKMKKIWKEHGLTINSSIAEHDKSPEKLPFHDKKAVFNGEKMNKGKENVNPHEKIVLKFADVPLGNLEWKCAKFHGKNAENCHKWKKIADELEKNAKIEYRPLLPSGKCSSKILGEMVLKHSIINIFNIAKGSNGKDGVQIANAPFTQEECKDKLHKGMNHRHKRNVEDEKFWKKLNNIVPRKQAMLFNMASNDLLTVGSIDFDDYRNEVATITNVNAEQLLEYDEKEFEKFGEKFEKEIFHKIAPKRIEKIISDAEDTFENVFGIFSTLKKVDEDNMEIDKTIKDIEEDQEKMKEEGISVDEYCKKECTALIEYDEKEANEIEKEKNEQEIKKGKEIVEHSEAKVTKAEHSEPKVTKAEHSDEPKVTKAEHSEPKVTKAEHSEPKVTKAEHSEPKVTKAEHSEPKVTKAEHSEPKVTKAGHSEPKVTKAEHSEPKVTKAEHSEPKVTKAEHSEPKVTKAEHSEPKVTKAEHSEPKVTKAEHSEPKVTKAEHSEPKVTKAEHSEPKLTKAGHPEPKVTKVEHSMPKESKVEHSLPKETKTEHSEPKVTKAEHSEPKVTKAEHSESKLTKAGHPEPKVTKVEHSLPKEMKKKDKGIEIVENTVPKTKNEDKVEEIKGHVKTEEMKESEIMESEIEHHGQHSEAIHNTNGVLSKVYNKSKEHVGNVAKFVGNKSWEIASHIGNKVVQAASNAWSKKTENSSNIGGSSQTLETPGTSKEPKETKKRDKGKGIEEIEESEIEDYGVQPETNDNSDSILNKMYNKSKENLGNAGKYVGKKSWEIASHIGNKVAQTATNTMTRKSENTSSSGSTQPAVKTPGTDKEPKETEEKDKGKEIVEKEIEDHGVQSEASDHSEGALSKMYNKSKENLGNAGKYVGKKSWEIASHIGNKVVQTTSNAWSKKPENTSHIVGSDHPIAKTPAGTAHIRLGHQMYQRKTEEPKVN